jgi:hypothetical protein
MEEFKHSLDLHIMQFRPNDIAAYEGFDSTRGKGYNEYLMIKKALQQMAHSNHPEVTHFLKITGRYAMTNVRQVLREVKQKIAEHDYVFIDDVKDAKILRAIPLRCLRNTWGESRFFVGQTKFYLEHLADIYKDMNDDSSFKFIAESVLYRLSVVYRHDKRFCFRLHTQVRFNGCPGFGAPAKMQSSAYRYDSFQNRCKSNLRQLGRIIIPFIWF